MGIAIRDRIAQRLWKILDPLPGINGQSIKTCGSPYNLPRGIFSYIFGYIRAWALRHFEYSSVNFEDVEARPYAISNAEMQITKTPEQDSSPS